MSRVNVCVTGTGSFLLAFTIECKPGFSTNIYSAYWVADKQLLTNEAKAGLSEGET